jgi:microcystin-dependent protein
MPDAKITELPSGTVAGDSVLPLVCEPSVNPTTCKATVAAILDFAFDEFFPVGSVVIRDAAPSRGTWEAFAPGRVMVGLDAGDADFDTAGEMGGAKTVTLTEAQMPVHTHVQDAHGHAVTDPGHAHVQGVNSTATGGLSGYTADTSTNTRVNSGYSTSSATTGLTVNNAAAVNQNAGGGEAHSNLQPYIVVKAWRRTA